MCKWSRSTIVAMAIPIGFTAGSSALCLQILRYCRFLKDIKVKVLATVVSQILEVQGGEGYWQRLWVDVQATAVCKFSRVNSPGCFGCSCLQLVEVKLSAEAVHRYLF